MEYNDDMILVPRKEYAELVQAQSVLNQIFIVAHKSSYTSEICQFIKWAEIAMKGENEDAE